MPTKIKKSSSERGKNVALNDPLKLDPFKANFYQGYDCYLQIDQ